MITKPIIENPLELQREIEFAYLAYLAWVGSIRELTDMFSHEISQPLTVISAYVSGCIRRLEEDVYDKQQIIDVLKAVNSQVDRAGNLLHRINEYDETIKLNYEKIV